MPLGLSSQWTAATWMFTGIQDSAAAMSKTLMTPSPVRFAVDLDLAEERRRAGPVEQRGAERQVGGLLARCNLVEGARVEEPAECAGRANEDSTKRMDKKSAIARICCEG